MSVCDIRGGFRMEYKSLKTKLKKKWQKYEKKMCKKSRQNKKECSCVLWTRETSKCLLDKDLRG